MLLTRTNNTVGRICLKKLFSRLRFV